MRTGRPVPCFWKTAPARGEKSESPTADQKINNKHDQYNPANTDPATISPSGIAETAPKDEEQYKDNQE
jgi:hypothetical protein